MTLSINPRLPTSTASSGSYEWQLQRRLYELFREYAQEINSNKADSIPLSPGKFLGDFVRNTADYVELGAASSKYTLDGWRWNGTLWQQKRSLTGN